MKDPLGNSTRMSVDMYRISFHIGTLTVQYFVIFIRNKSNSIQQPLGNTENMKIKLFCQENVYWRSN